MYVANVRKSVLLFVVLWGVCSYMIPILYRARSRNAQITDQNCRKRPNATIQSILEYNTTTGIIEIFNIILSRKKSASQFSI